MSSPSPTRCSSWQTGAIMWSESWIMKVDSSPDFALVRQGQETGLQKFVLWAPLRRWCCRETICTLETTRRSEEWNVSPIRRINSCLLSLRNCSTNQSPHYSQSAEQWRLRRPLLRWELSLQSTLWHHQDLDLTDITVALGSGSNSGQVKKCPAGISLVTDAVTKRSTYTYRDGDEEYQLQLPAGTYPLSIASPSRQCQLNVQVFCKYTLEYSRFHDAIQSTAETKCRFTQRRDRDSRRD